MTIYSLQVPALNGKECIITYAMDLRVPHPEVQVINLEFLDENLQTVQVSDAEWLRVMRGTKGSHYAALLGNAALRDGIATRFHHFYNRHIRGPANAEPVILRQDQYIDYMGRQGCGM